MNNIYNWYNFFNLHKMYLRPETKLNMLKDNLWALISDFNERSTINNNINEGTMKKIFWFSGFLSRFSYCVLVSAGWAWPAPVGVVAAAGAEAYAAGSPPCAAVRPG